LRAYNVSSQEYWRMSDALEVMRRLVPEAAIEVGSGLVAELDLQGPFDCSAALRDLGYAPAWRLERGLAQYAEWLNNHEV
jgi:UDP-glucose 4-epimerase